MATLGFTNDWVQLPEDGTGKKTGYYRWDTGGGDYLYLGAGVIVGATGEIAPVDDTAGLKVDLGADNDVTVTGNVAVTNADLTSIKTAVEILDNAISGSEMQVDVVAALPAGTNNIGDVDVLTLPALPAGNNNIGDVDVASSVLPTGAATSANQTTVIGHLDGVEGLLTTIAGAVRAEDIGSADGHTGFVTMAVRKATPANVSGTDGDYEMLQISAGRLWTSAVIDTALPAGTNNIGDVDVLTLPALPAGNNNIGDVDVATLPALTTGDNTVGRVKITDGTLTATVRDTGSTDSLNVAVVDGSGNHITSFGGGTQYAEDTASTAADLLSMAGVVRKDSAASLVDTDGDRTQLQVDEDGKLWTNVSGSVSLASGSQNIGDIDVESLPGTVEADIAAMKGSLMILDDTVGGTELQVDVIESALPTGAATSANQSTVIGHLDGVEGLLTTISGAVRAEDVASANAHTGLVTMAVRKATPANTSDTDGDYEMLQMSAGRLWTSAVLEAGNANIGDVDIASIASGTQIEAIGDVASDIPIAANPVTVGGRASAVAPTAVSADGDAVNAWLTRLGAQVVAGLPHLGLVGDVYTLTSKTVQQTTTQTGTDVLTPTSGKKLVIVSYQIQASGTTAADVQLWFGANADTTYTRGTDLAIFDGNFKPSSTSAPGVTQTGVWIASAVDHEVHLTTSAGITITVTLWYYEI